MDMVAFDGSCIKGGMLVAKHAEWDGRMELRLSQRFQSEEYKVPVISLKLVPTCHDRGHGKRSMLLMLLEDGESTWKINICNPSRSTFQASHWLVFSPSGLLVNAHKHKREEKEQGAAVLHIRR